MAKKNGRKSSGAAGIAVIEDPVEATKAPDAGGTTHEVELVPSKPKRKTSDKQQSNGKHVAFS